MNLLIFGTGAHARKACHCWTLASGIVTAFADENPAASIRLHAEERGAGSAL